MKSPLRFRLTFRPNSPAPLVGFAFLLRRDLTPGLADSWARFATLLRALYGPCGKCGTMWEVHCDKHVQSVGFKLVGEEWQSCYFHPTLKLYLVVYVDDFKLSGPKDNLSAGWPLILEGLDIEPPCRSVCTLGVPTKKVL